MTAATTPVEATRAGPITTLAARLRREASVIGLLLLLGISGFLGIRSSTVTARSPDGWTLRVEHAQVTRAGIAVPFHVTVQHVGGFSGPVTLALSNSLPERFDFQNFYPNPGKETATASRLLYEFDPPPGNTLRISLDARTAPDQNGSTEVYHTAVLVDGQVVASVRFRMWVMP